MSRRLLVTGARGLLGGAIVSSALARGWEPVGVGRAAGTLPGGVAVLGADLADADAGEAVVVASRATIIVHAAAQTSIDECEEHPDLAWRVNAEGSAGIARGAARIGARLVHVSTDAVFDGDAEAYDEDAEARPRNVYAATKREGERRVLSACPGALVLRMNFFGVRPGPPGGSLAEWALGELAAGRVVPGFSDVSFNPLWNVHAAEALLDLAGLGTRGVLHLGSPERLSKLEFVRSLARAFGFPPDRVREARAADRAWRAARPLCTVLRASKAEALLGRRLPTVAQGIEGLRASLPATGRPRPLRGATHEQS
jgi:dTDP-4-dehydrorhamnose reductase